jgi:hypothetical protein
MSRLGRGSAALVGLVVVFGLMAGIPARADYTKLYRFRNSTGVNQYSVQAITDGLELITSDYAYPSGWGPPAIGYTVVSGVYGTTITFGGAAVGRNANVMIGWQTSDNSCGLRDLRWGGGQSVVPTQLGGTPGGGLVLYDYPEPGDLTVIITNDLEDPGAVLTLTGIEFALSPSELSLPELGDLSEAGLVELRVALIDRDISELRDEIAQAQGLPSPSRNSLIRKLNKALGLVYDGLADYLEGDVDGALVLWARASHQMDNVISEVTDDSARGNLSDALYDRWIVTGDGEIRTVPEIRDAIAALPGGVPIQSLPPVSPDDLPALPGLDPAQYQPWPATELSPGQWTAFVLHAINEGESVVMGGTITDALGNPVLDWLEQGVAEPMVLDTEPPVITGASADPANLWPPDHSMVKVAVDATVSDNTWALAYVAGVSSNQPENGLGDGDEAPDCWLDPNDPESVWLRAERSGNDPTQVREYTITLMAIDLAGNLSAPYQLVVPVVHDQS